LQGQPTLPWLFFSFSGRISPAACLLGGMFVLVVQMFLLFAWARAFNAAPQSPADFFWGSAASISVLVGVWANFALTAKRFHDFGKPTVFGAISLVAGLILFVILAFIKSDPGPNRYGAATNQPK